MERMCSTCVKVSGKVRCRVLTEPVGTGAECWAHSSDPEFWKKLRRSVEAYRRAYSARHGFASSA